MRLLIALGGNAMTGPDGSATPEAQQRAVGEAMRQVAHLVVDGHEIVLTHGNGPQVGNLLVKNEIAASVVPPVPLDWCGAQTQGTLGVTILDELEASLAALGRRTPVAVVVTRTLVDADDPAFASPSKPIGRYLPEQDVAPLVAHGQVWQDRGQQGWRRVVASPAPLEVLDAPAAKVLLDAGYVVVCAGGGGVPTVRDPDGRLRGVEAVIDKDLTAAVLAAKLGVDVLVVATDVDAAVLAWGTPEARPLGPIRAGELRGHADGGAFASGSMGPKVEAVLRFVEAGGSRAVITSLGQIGHAVHGEAGTVVSA